MWLSPLSLLGYIVTPDLQPISNSLQLGYNHLFSSHWSLDFLSQTLRSLIWRSPVIVLWEQLLKEGKGRWKTEWPTTELPFLGLFSYIPFLMLYFHTFLLPYLHTHILLEFQPLETMFTVPSHTTDWLKLLLMRTLPLRSEKAATVWWHCTLLFSCLYMSQQSLKVIKGGASLF